VDVDTILCGVRMWMCVRVGGEEEYGCRGEVCGRWCVETNNGRRMLHGNSYYILVARGTCTLQIFLECILDRLPPNTVKSCVDRRKADSTLQVCGLYRCG